MLTECISNTTTDDSLNLWINVMMAVIALVSAVCAWLTYNHQKSRSKKAEACNLAAHYAKVILDKHSFITSVFIQTGIDQYIKSNISMSDIQNFDRSEMERLLAKKDISSDEFMKKIYDVDPVVILNCKLARIGTTLERDLIVADHIVIDEDSGERKLRNEKFLINDFHQEIGELLNQLEWFGMNFQYEVADESLLYQSLHKTYLSMVWMLYPFISYQNINNEDKLFTNVVWLFDEWRKRLKKITGKAQKTKNAYRKRAAKRKARADRKRRKADMETAKAERENQKADSVQAEVHKGQKV